MSDGGIYVSSSVAIRIQNLKFTNCGISNAYKNFTAVISFLNVQSIVLSNITFENSLGHAIVGINVLGSSMLENITVYHNNNLSGNYLRPMGGIILVYVDTIDGVHHNQTQSDNNVHIHNCTICCMSQQFSHNICSTKIPLISSIFGLFLQQQKYSINVTIVDTKITKIISRNSLLVYVVHKSSMNNSVSFSNTTFTKITSNKFPVIKLSVLEHHLKESILSFQLKNCMLSSNTAKLVVFTQSSHYTEVNFEIISVELSYNKRAHCIWKSSNNASNLTITDCTIESNNNFDMQIAYFQTIKFTNNLFYNTLLYPQQSLIDLSHNTFTIFEENNEFTFNKANVIICLNEVSYIYIKEGCTLNISFNCAKLYATKRGSLIAFSKDLKNNLCRFQFLSNKGNLDQDFTDNNTINFNLVFNNNHNYTSIIYGTLLNSCQWLPNGAFLQVLCTKE